MGLIPNIAYSYMFLSCQIGLQKPFKEIYNHVENSTGLKPDQILFIDDQEDYLQGAINNGWRTFLFNKNSQEESCKKFEDLII